MKAALFVTLLFVAACTPTREEVSADPTSIEAIEPTPMERALLKEQENRRIRDEANRATIDAIRATRPPVPR